MCVYVCVCVCVCVYINISISASISSYSPSGWAPIAWRNSAPAARFINSSPDPMRSSENPTSKVCFFFFFFFWDQINDFKKKKIELNI